MSGLSGSSAVSRRSSFGTISNPGVDKPCTYEPDINPTYHDLAEHYGAVVIPARVAKPKDKTKAE
jgi:hypothetical protein